MKRKLDRVAVAMGIAGVVTYAYGVDQSMWSRAALGAGIVVFGFAVKEIEFTQQNARRSRKSGNLSAGTRYLRRGSGADH